MDYFNGPISFKPTPLKALKRHLDQGGLVVYATDTLWALGCAPDNQEALRRLQRAKGTPSHQPFSVALENSAGIRELGHSNSVARKLVEAFLPGPLTLVLEASPWVKEHWPGCVGPDGSIGLRCPRHAGCEEILGRVGPLVATSANLHTHSTARTEVEARSFCELLTQRGLPTAFIYLEPLPKNIASTVVKLGQGKPKVLRWGAIDPQALKEALA